MVKNQQKLGWSRSRWIGCKLPWLQTTLSTFGTWDSDLSDNRVCLWKLLLWNPLPSTKKTLSKIMLQFMLLQVGMMMIWWIFWRFFFNTSKKHVIFFLWNHLFLGVVFFWVKTVLPTWHLQLCRFLLVPFGSRFLCITLFFPNSFSYGVFANIGSGAVPGGLPNHGFREGSGTGSGAVGDNTWAYSAISGFSRHPNY